MAFPSGLEISPSVMKEVRADESSLEFSISLLIHVDGRPWVWADNIKEPGDRVERTD